jgi:hypothetical protein
MMCQAIEIHGDKFRMSEVRREVYRKTGANPDRDAATRQLPSLPGVELGKKRRTRRYFSS